MIVTLQTQRVRSLEQVRAFLEGSEAVDFVEGDREGVYDLVRRTLVKLGYHRLGKPDKGLVKRYPGKVTGLKGTAHAPDRTASQDRTGGGSARSGERQCADLLDIGYWHVVFTLPHQLNALVRRHPRTIHRLLFDAASRTLLEFGRNPRWLGGELGITMVLHTWGQNLGQHVHVHRIVTDGGLSPDGQRWVTPPRGFLFPTAALSKVFRGKYLDALATAHRKGEVHLRGTGEPDEDRAFDCLRASLQSQDWVVYSKPPFADAGQVLAYLGRYTHKTAMTMCLEPTNVPHRSTLMASPPSLCPARTDTVAKTSALSRSRMPKRGSSDRLGCNRPSVEKN